MKRAVAAIVVAVVAGSVSIGAQWAPYPAKDVPKTPDGKPNLDAPAPRTADGKPSFAGVWRGAPAGPGRGGRAGAAPVAPSSGPPIATFRDIGSTVPGGLPLTDWGKQELARRVAGNSRDNPEAHCLPMGIMQFHTQGFPRKFIQTPEEIVILYEASSGIRQIFTDGRPLPTDDPQPWYYGYSVGRWQGDTLVVETTGFRDDGWLDIIGSPLTESGKITERFRRPTFGRMEIDITVEDPKAYTKPWTVRHVQEIMLDTELIEFICEETNRFK
jgi:hypothetical protein